MRNAMAVGDDATGVLYWDPFISYYKDMAVTDRSVYARACCHKGCPLPKTGWAVLKVGVGATGMVFYEPLNFIILGCNR
jgi:hypothetical protein